MSQEKKLDQAVESLDSNLFFEILAFLEKKQLKVREAVVGNTRKEYIKEKEVGKIWETEKEEIIKIFNKASNYKLKSTDSANDFFGILLKEKILFVGVPQEHEKNLKFPKRLNAATAKESSIDESSTAAQKKRFFVLAQPRQEKKSHFWLILIIVIVLSVCLFPLWPLEMKLTIWWVSWILSVAMVSAFFY